MNISTYSQEGEDEINLREHQRRVMEELDKSELIDLLFEANAEIDRLEAEVKAMSADDQKAETLKWRRMYEDAVRKQGEAMDQAKQATDREAWVMRQLRRCGKAIGQEDPTKTAAAVEAFVRQHKVAA